MNIDKIKELLETAKNRLKDDEVYLSEALAELEKEEKPQTCEGCKFTGCADRRLNTYCDSYTPNQPCSTCGGSGNTEPTSQDLESPMFNAIWGAIKYWDIQRKADKGYAGATGTDVMTIINAIKGTGRKE